MTKQRSKKIPKSIEGQLDRVGKQIFISFTLSDILATQELGFGPDGVPQGTFQGWVRMCLRAGNEDKGLIARYKKIVEAREKVVAKRREVERRRKERPSPLDRPQRTECTP